MSFRGAGFPVAPLFVLLSAVLLSDSASADGPISYETSFGSHGSGKDQFKHLVDVELSPGGERIYAADRTNAFSVSLPEPTDVPVALAGI